jgi:hypothetical protein
MRHTSRRPARIALSLSVSLVATTGCYASHERGGASPDASARDAGRAPDASRPVDALIVRPDATLPPSCGPRALDVACTDTGTMMIPVGRPHALPVHFGDGRGCFCGETLACAASVVGGELHLETAMCAELLCDGCFPYVDGTCPLPPMAEGSYRVRVNGLEAFDLLVSDATPAIGPVDQCVRPPSDALGCGYDYAPVAQPADELCHDAAAPAGRPIAVEVRSFCLPCGALWGPCQVIRTAQTVRVIPFRVTTRCDVDCPAECAESTTVCTIPPLEPGEYDVSVDGLEVSTRLVVGDEPRPGRVCQSRPED